jgi:1-acyl-sn-glycerol-3-phosphate acyltransferase
MTETKHPTPPGEARRNLLRTLYTPYTWGVFIPLFGATTVVCGSLAIATSYVSTSFSEVFGTIWGWLCCRWNFVRVRVRGRENIRKGQSYVVMANHQSHFDIFTIYGYLGIPFRWVIKEELKKTPFVGGYTRRAGHIFVDRRNRERAIASLQEARSRLTDGVSVFFFPEGTRSRDGRLMPFKKGGFRTALDLGLPILPVSISGACHILPGKSFKLLPGTANITIHPPIDTSRYTVETQDELMAETRKVIRAALTEWERNGEE